MNIHTSVHKPKLEINVPVDSKVSLEMQSLLHAMNAKHARPLEIAHNACDVELVGDPLNLANEDQASLSKVSRKPNPTTSKMDNNSNREVTDALDRYHHAVIELNKQTVAVLAAQIEHLTQQLRQFQNQRRNDPRNW